MIKIWLMAAVVLAAVLALAFALVMVGEADSAPPADSGGISIEFDTDPHDSQKGGKRR